MSSPSLVLYHGAPTRSVRLVILLEELGVKDYEVKPVDFMKGEHLTPEHGVVSKGWKTLPVLNIGEDTVLESGAALELLLERFGKPGQLQPAVGSKERASYLYWLWFAEATFAQAATGYVKQTVLYPEDARDPKTAARLKAVTIQSLDALEAQLADGRQFVLGKELSAADISLVYPLFLAVVFGKLADKESYPKVTALFERIMARPSAKKAYGAMAPSTS